MQKTQGSDSINAIEILRLFALKGHLYGAAQPSLVCLLEIADYGEIDWLVVDAALERLISRLDDSPATFDTGVLNGLIQRVAFWTSALQTAAHYPALDSARILFSGDNGRVLLALPTIEETVAAAALKITIAIINGCLAHQAEDADFATIRRDIKALQQKGSVDGANQPGMAYFLRAAQQRHIPWFRLLGNTFQIGQGAHLRWLQSSLTDISPKLGHTFAGNKAHASHLLRLAGVPTPAHYLVRDEEAAVRCANALGYPVVIKPMSAELGRGVRTDLNRDAAVRQAFNAARSFGEMVLVEKFIEGRDYRMLVHEGELIWAAERVHGGVTGDGKSTIQQLVEQLNADPRRNDGSKGGLRFLLIDEEAHERLTAANLTMQSVPASGVHVRLRSAANQGRGGTSFDAFENVHPDNRRVAERAALALGLDVAGVDLIIPDITRSWRDTGGAVCEINSRPGLRFADGLHVFGQILDRMLAGGDGRIPSALLIGGGGLEKCALIGRLLLTAGRRVGVASSQGVTIGDEIILSGPTEAYDGTRILVGDRSVEAAVVAIDDAHSLRTGLAFDRFSVVVLATSDIKEPHDETTFRRFLAAFIPPDQSSVIINADDSLCLSVSKHIDGAKICLFSGEPPSADILAHLTRGHMAVWLSPTAEAVRLSINNAPQGSFELTLSKSLTFDPRDIAMAASVSLILGCSEDHLRQILCH